MGAEPVWCLFRVQSQDSKKVKKAFNKAIKQSKVTQKLKDYIQSRKSLPTTSEYPFTEILREFYPQAFANIPDSSDFFDWEDMYNTPDLFFPKAFTRMIEQLFTGTSPIMSMSIDDATIDFVSSTRFGVSQFLYTGLGWKRAIRLPGYCGNMFIPLEDLRCILTDIEQIFAEVDEEDFYARACAIGAEDSYCSLDKLFFLPLALSKVLREGNGFLALNYPHLGNFPFPGNEPYDNY
ncbi:MAG: hypothetical protein F6K42_15015 [Leptolyngbya sp. SIO1D8]|nr:hypothetical protein [Leptolyngbya sp. SIO1D8]